MYGERHSSVSFRGHRGVLELDLPGISAEAECSKGLIQDGSPSRLGRRRTRVCRATSAMRLHLGGEV